MIIDLKPMFSHPNQSYPLNGEVELDASVLSYANTKLECPIKFIGSAIYTNPNVEVEGEISIRFSCSCDSCGETTLKDINLTFQQVFMRNSDDPDEYTYQFDKLNISKAIEDEIRLTCDTQILCNDDCKGLCLQCGCNLNQGTCNCDKANAPRANNPFSALDKIIK